MKYETALSVAKKSVDILESEDGNLSAAEMVVHVAALDLATQVIAKRNNIVLPLRSAA